MIFLFELIISNIIKIVEFLILNESQIFLASNCTIWQKHQSILFSFSNTWISVCSIFLTTDTVGFYCFYIIYFTEFFISSFILLYYLNTLFTERNSSWLIYESIKKLEVKTSRVSNLHCVKSVRIQSYSGPYFPAFGLNTEYLSVSSPNAGKYRPE